MNLDIYDCNMNRVLILENRYKSCYWSEGYNAAGFLILELDAIDYYVQSIKEDYYVGRRDRKTLMVIKAIQIQSDKIIISGKQGTAVLEDVAFIGSIKSGGYVDKEIEKAYNESNKIESVSVVSCNLGVKYNHQISNKTMLELSQTMCQSTDVGIRMVLEGDVAQVEFYKPRPNPNLIFSENFGNVSLDRLARSVEQFKNYAIVLGEGNSENRVRVDVDLTNGERRREIVVDARDIQKDEDETEEDYSSRLYSRGYEKLIQNNRDVSYRFTPNTADFGKKYDLGDVISVYLPRYSINNKFRITGFEQKGQRNKITTTIQVGLFLG